MAKRTMSDQCPLILPNYVHALNIRVPGINVFYLCVFSGVSSCCYMYVCHFIDVLLVYKPMTYDKIKSLCDDG